MVNSRLLSPLALVSFLLLASTCLCDAVLQQEHIDRILRQLPRTPMDRSYTKTPDGRREVRQTPPVDVDIETTITPDGKTRQLATGMIKCRLWQNCISYENVISETHQWECSFDDPGIQQQHRGYSNKIIVGPNDEPLNEFLELNGAVSRQSVLVMSSAVLTEGRIIVNPLNVVGIEKYGDTEAAAAAQGQEVGELRVLRKPLKGLPPPRSRRLADTMGPLKTLVVRVNAQDSSPPPATAISEDVFNDEYCLKSQYNRCSYGKLRIEEYVPGGTVTVPTVANAPGVLDLFVDSNANGNTKEALQQEANTKLREMFGGGDPGSIFDLVLFCMPPGTGNWLAYAYIGRWDSYFNNDWCQAVSSQMHEVGHSIGLHHSGEYDGSDSAAQEYGDQSDMMGYSYRSDDTPAMCFNPAKSYQLGWYSDKVLDVNPNDLRSEPTSYMLNGVVDYGDSTTGSKIVLRVNDFYIGFNRATSFNSGVLEAANQVTVVEKLGSPTSSTKSKLIGKLSVGGTTVIQLTDFFSVQVTYASNSNGKDAVIEMSVVGDEIVCQGEYDAEVTVEIVTDNYPQETSWGIADSVGQYVFFKDDYRVVGTYTQVVTGLCRGLDYLFIIQDAYGDGICCNWGNGSYTVKYNGEVLFSGNDFTAEKVVPFTLPLPPTSSPTAAPTSGPTAVPTSSPTAAPTSEPTASPTSTLSGTPTSEPTASPTSTLSGTPTSEPTASPTSTLSGTPTSEPTASPTSTLSGTPTSEPTASPTSGPTAAPTSGPTASPTSSPVSGPTMVPTISPTKVPTSNPINDNDNCVDDPNFIYRGKDGKDCNWVAKGKDRNVRIKCLRRASKDKTDRTKVFTFCRATCDRAGIRKACP